MGEKEVARVDGWGHLIGDAGSSSGSDALLEAAMRGYDGRRTTALIERSPPTSERREGVHGS